MKKFKVENIFVFGKSSRIAAEDDLDLIVGTPTNEYHILRHYSPLPESYSNTLIGIEYEYFDYQQQKFLQSKISPEDINAAYQIKGTKFYPNVAGIENPRKLIGFIKSELQKRIAQKSMYWIRKPQFDTLMFTLTYPQVVGDQDLIPIATLSKEQQSKIKTIARGNNEGERSIMIKTISDIPKIPTTHISVEINLLRQKSFAYMTAYPSELTPGFPLSNQYSEEYEYNKQFWNTHVFIV